MARLSYLNFFLGQWRSVPPVEPADLTGKTVVVIGANTGIGYEATKHFAKMNPGRLILGCRDRYRGTSAVSRLETEAGYGRGELWLIDLASFSSVRAFADKFEKEGGRLDYLIMNAAVVAHAYKPTEDGWEQSLQVNCLAPSLLSMLLLPRMIETGRDHSIVPRLVMVSSETHYWTFFDQQILGSQEPLRVLGSKDYWTDETKDERYAQTKLINIFFVRALAERLANVPLIVDAVNPGFCSSELGRDITGFGLVMFWLMQKLIAWTSEQGSRQLIWAALGGRDQEENLRGAYVSFFQVAEPSDFVISKQGQDIQDKLWKEMIDILGNVDARVKTISTQYLPKN